MDIAIPFLSLLKNTIVLYHFISAVFVFTVFFFSQTAFHTTHWRLESHGNQDRLQVNVQVNLCYKLLVQSYYSKISSVLDILT